MAIGNALRALEGDREITPDEITEERLTQLRLEIEACSPEQSAECISILDEAISRAEGEAQTGLQELRNGISISESDETLTDSSYSIEALIEGQSDEMTQNFIEMYQSQIANNLSEIYGAAYESLSPIGKNTVELIFWDIIQSSISIRGAVNVGVGQITSFTQGIAGIFQGGSINENEEGGGLSEGSIISRAVRGNIEGLRNVPDVGSDIIEDLESTIALVDSLIGTQADRLNVLLQETQSLGDQKNQIFENPQILRAILDSGAYEENGFNINLHSSPVVIELGNVSESNMEQVRNEFIQELQSESNNLGGSIERIRGLADRADSLFESFGYEGGVDEFVNSLSNLPMVGFIFQMIFGNFFSQFEQTENFDAVMRTIDRLRGNSPIQADAIENFHRNFIPSFTSNQDNADHPFTLLIAQTPISDNFANEVTPFFDTINNFNQTSEIDVRASDTDFWNRILTGEGANEHETEIFNTVNVAFGRTGFSEASFIAALNSVNLVPAPDATPEPQPGVDAAGVILPTDPNFIGPMPLAEQLDGASETQTTLSEFTDADSFPFIFEGVEINYNSSNFELQVGENNFRVSNISGMEITADILLQASPNIEIGEGNIIITYNLPLVGRSSQSLSRNLFPDFLRQTVSGDSATLSIPNSDSPNNSTEILFSKIT